MSGSLHSNFGQSAKSLLHFKKLHFTQKRSDFFYEKQTNEKVDLGQFDQKTKNENITYKHYIT